MYRRVYRQEGGGLSNLGSEAFMRQYVDNYVQDYNRRNQGEVAAKVRSKRRLPTNPEERLIPQVIDKLNPEAWLYRGATEPITDARKYVQNLPFKEALELDKTSYAYNPKLSPNPPTTKVGEFFDKKLYEGKGIASLTGADVGPIGGGTPGTRKVYETVMDIPGLEKTLKTVGRVAGPVGTGLSIADAITRYKAGDYGGAVLSTLSAIPGFGIPATVAQLGTDYLGITGNKDNNQVQPLTKEEFEQTLPEGYKPLNSTYDAYFDTPYDERVKTRKGSYSGMPIILSPENAHYFQTYFQGPDSQLHTRPEDRVNAFQPVQAQPQGLPSLMKIVNEQRNPTPVDPDAPYGYVEYTPPFYGGMAIPPGGNKPYMVPADKDGNPVNPKGIFKATL
jgi:hypothetical protein